MDSAREGTEIAGNVARDPSVFLLLPPHKDRIRYSSTTSAFPRSPRGLSVRQRSSASTTQFATESVLARTICTFCLLFLRYSLLQTTAQWLLRCCSQWFLPGLPGSDQRHMPDVFHSEWTVCWKWSMCRWCGLSEFLLPMFNKHPKVRYPLFKPLLSPV